MMKQPLARTFDSSEHRHRIDGVLVGRLCSVEPSGEVLVDFSGNPSGPLRARFAGSLSLEILKRSCSLKKEVLLLFEHGDPSAPIIIDLLHSMLDEIVEAPDLDLQVVEKDDVTIDGKRISFNADEEIVLRCGKSSITLTKSGKVLIRGAYLLNRSSGVNRIKGGSVQIN